MEEIAEVIFRFLGNSIKWFLWELLFDVVLFNLGRVFLLMFTLGRYPRDYDIDRDANKIAWIGFLVILLIWVIIVLLNNFA